MLKTYTQSEMLAYWKRRLGLRTSTALGDATDMTELDRKLLDDIDIWYEDLLAEAPASHLPVEDVADEASGYYISDNAAEITPPERGVRLLSLKLSDWRQAETESYSVYSDIGRLQRNRLTRATAEEPVVLHRPGHYEAHGLSWSPFDINSALKPDYTPIVDRPVITQMEMVVRPPQGYYTLDTTLLRRSHLYIN